MSNTLKFFRWFIASILILVLFAFILVAIPTTAVSIKLTNKETPKEWLKDSGIYDKVIEIVGEAAATAGEGKIDLSPLKDKLKDHNSELYKSAAVILNPIFLENTSSKIIEATYDWMNAKTVKPTFDITITSDKTALENFFAALFKERLQLVPICSSALNNQDNKGKDFNPLEATCRPADLDLNKINEFIRQNSNDEGFKEILNNAKISSKNLEIPTKTTENVQFAYKTAKIVPFIVFGVILIISIILLLLIPGIKTGLSTVANVLIFPSIILMVVSFGASKNLDIAINALGKAVDEKGLALFKSAGEPVIKTVLTDLLTTVLIYSTVLFVVSLVLFGIRIYLGKKAKADLGTIRV
jgi:hypothetical protein